MLSAVVRYFVQWLRKSFLILNSYSFLKLLNTKSYELEPWSYWSICDTGQRCQEHQPWGGKIGIFLAVLPKWTLEGCRQYSSSTLFWMRQNFLTKGLGLSYLLFMEMSLLECFQRIISSISKDFHIFKHMGSIFPFQISYNGRERHFVLVTSCHQNNQTSKIFS